jgi:cell fate regulator YaaT (PSP1 superfamily)
VKVLSVRVRDRGHTVAYAVPDDLAVDAGATVVVTGEHGPTYGVAASAARVTPEVLRCCQRPRAAIGRVADAGDLVQVDALRRREAEALDFCRERAEALGLDMKVTDMEGTLAEKHLTCSFTADERVDFRQLVKDLGRRFQCHVLMRQIPPREEARRIGGFGPCGRELCCATFLPRPLAVTSRQARRAAPGIAPAKLTGSCGKLMCCLAYGDAGEESARLPDLVALS